MTTTHTVGAFTFTDKSLADRLAAFLAELPPEYHSYVVESDLYGLQFCHPFCHVLSFDVLPVSNLVDTITCMSAVHEKNCADGDFESALSAVVKPYRREYLCDLIDEHGVEPMYSAIRSVWISVEGMQHRFDEWNEIWSHVIDGDGDPLQVMGVDDRKIYDALPDMLTVFRGFQNDGGEYGWSWTLDRTKAEWFARRGCSEAKVATVTIPKRVTLAYFGERNEAEIVIHPEQFGDEIIIEELSRNGAAA